MVHVYTVTIPLIYNRFDIIDPEHTTELRLGLKEEITAEFDTVFRSYDIPGYPDGYDFGDKIRISLYTKNDEEFETTGSSVGSEVYCRNRRTNL